MNKWIILLSFALAHVTLCGQDVPAKPTLFSELSTEGELKMKDGVPFSGEAYFLTSEGKPSSMYTYVDGEKNGLWRVWHPNGHLKMEGTKQSGLKHGAYHEYHGDGSLKTEEHYDMGKRTGRWLEYAAGGKMKSERHFENDLPHGRVVFYDAEGKPRITEEYKNGVKVSSDRFKSSGGVTITTTRTPRSETK